MTNFSTLLGCSGSCCFLTGSLFHCFLSCCEIGIKYCIANSIFPRQSKFYSWCPTLTFVKCYSLKLTRRSKTFANVPALKIPAKLKHSQRLNWLPSVPLPKKVYPFSKCNVLSTIHGSLKAEYQSEVVKDFLLQPKRGISNRTR